MVEKSVLFVKKREMKNAGSKAVDDVNYFLKSEGFFIIGFNKGGNKLDKIYNLLFNFFKKFKKIKKSSEVIIQYPFGSIFSSQIIVKLLRIFTKCKIIVIVHDVDSIRYYEPENDLRNLKRELKFFNSVEGLIVHSNSMVKWLHERGVHKPMSTINLFDYKNSTNLNYENLMKGICFAGDLGKSKFLEKMDAKTIFYVFGPHPSQNYKKCIKYFGSFDSSVLPNKLTQQFGLVWDGDSLNSCHGQFGNYTRYNAPHKTSLYLSCGMPVIVWSKAAVSNFVNENHVGIVVESLKDIDYILSRISDEEYSVLKKNAISVGKKLRSGFFLKRSLTRVESKL